LIRVINLSDDPVWIVINRSELCRDVSAVAFINILLSVVKDSDRCVRILVVQRSEWWDVERYERKVDVRGIKSDMFLRLRKDQHRRR